MKSQINAETIWDYEESIHKDMKLYDTIFREAWHWYEAYKFYLNYNFNILIKIDDDICFIDINRFDEFINFIKSSKKNITIPNLVNHAVSLSYNFKFNLIPNSIMQNFFANRTTTLDLNRFYRGGHQIKKIHKFFLDNKNKFIKNNIKPIKLDGQRPSICMFGIVKESYNYIYNPKSIWKNSNYPKDYFFIDEPYAYSLENNYFFPRFVCVHYAFSFQRLSGFTEDLLENYKYLSNDIIADDI